MNSIFDQYIKINFTFNLLIILIPKAIRLNDVSVVKNDLTTLIKLKKLQIQI